MGYHRAGFDEIVGVDIRPMPRYPFEFVQADAMPLMDRLLEGGWFGGPPTTKQQYSLSHFDAIHAIHASPPCQAYSVTQALHKNKHPDLVAPIRERLKSTGAPYVIENVVGAPLENPLMLCGSMFDLRVYRHRLFECQPAIWWPPCTCNHSFPMPASKGQYHTLEKQNFITAVGHNFAAESGRKAMKIDWMTRDELSQAIPPAYCEYIGKALLKVLT